MEYKKKSFSVRMGNGSTQADDKFIPGLDGEEAKRSEQEKKELSNKVNQEIKELNKGNKKSKRIIPYGDRILVQRKVVGSKIGNGLLYAADTTADRPTDVAEVVYVPDHTFCDEQLITNSDKIVAGLTKKAEEGDSQAVISLLRFNEYLKLKTLKPGDTLLIGKYVGTDFAIKETGQNLTVIDGDGIYALIVETN